MLKTLQNYKCKRFNINLIIFNLIDSRIPKLIHMFANKSK